MRILITGANGFIGRHVCQIASAQGHSVVALLRPNVEYREYPVCDDIVYGTLPYEIPDSVFVGLDCIIHLAAATTGQCETEAMAINVEGTAFLLHHFKKLSSSDGRFIFISSQSAKPGAVSVYGKTKYLGEELVRASGFTHCIIRPGLVLGSASQGLFYRMRKIVKMLPFVPLLGGGKAMVQPIEVDVLAQGIVNCLTLSSDGNAEFNLGDPEGITLKEVFILIVRADVGKNRLEVYIPTWPVKLGIRFLQFLHLPSPISMDNILGMENVERMDTASSMQKLNIDVRPISEMIYSSMRPGTVQDVPHGEVPLRILLVGCGKIGVVHALNLSLREGICLSAIVDRSKSAMAMYKSIGFKGKCYTDLAEAIRVSAPDGAIIATPGGSHFEIAKMLLEKNIPILMEKPVSVRQEQLGEFAMLAEQFKKVPFHVGYMAAQHPHLDAVLKLLRDGELGKVLGFRALALQSHVMSRKPVTWEMRRATSGGGVVLNFAGHLIAIICRLFGKSSSVECKSDTIYSIDVEDVAELGFTYPNFQGRMVTSWSISGYDRPLYKLQIDCEHGSVIFENAYVMLVRNGKMTMLKTQMDYDASVGYNSAPDYTGGAFAREHKNFAREIMMFKKGLYEPKENADSCSKHPVSICEALEIDQIVHDCYAKSSDSTESSRVTVEKYAVAKETDLKFDSILNELYELTNNGVSDK